MVALAKKIRNISAAALGPEKAKADLCVVLGSRFARPLRLITGRAVKAWVVSLGLLLKHVPPGVTTGSTAHWLGRRVGSS